MPNNSLPELSLFNQKVPEETTLSHLDSKHHGGRLASHVSDEKAKFSDSSELFLLSLAELPKESSRLQV